MRLYDDDTTENYRVFDEAVRCINEFGFIEIEIWNGDIKRVTSEEELKKLLNL